MLPAISRRGRKDVSAPMTRAVGDNPKPGVRRGAAGTALGGVSPNLWTLQALARAHVAAARCPFPAPGDTRRASRLVFRVRRCVALSAGPKARQARSSAPRVAARCPVAVRSAVRKMRPHRRFARTVAPRSLVTRHLPLPVHLKLHRRLPIFVSRRSSQTLRRQSTASARRSPRCSPTSRARRS